MAGGAEDTAEEFGKLFGNLSSWGQWGEGDERGALNRLGPERVVEAARLVREMTLAHRRVASAASPVDSPQR